MNDAEPAVSGTNPAGPESPRIEDEVVYYEGSPALRGTLGQLIFNALAGAGLVAAAIYFKAHASWLPLAAGGVALLMLVMPVLITWTTRYRITSYRIDFERGVLSKHIDTLELWHVEDLKFRQSLLDRILRIGQIAVVSRDGTTPYLALSDLPNARPVFESLKQRIITVKRQRGVIKLDAG